MTAYQRSFFDDSDLLNALRHFADPLMELSKHIDFEMLRPEFEEALRKEDRKSPDFRTFWKFRDQLATKGIERELFDLFHAKLDQEGVFAKAGSIVDATIVEVPRQRNSRKENAEIKTPLGKARGIPVFEEPV